MARKARKRPTGRSAASRPKRSSPRRRRRRRSPSRLVAKTGGKAPGRNAHGDKAEARARQAARKDAKKAAKTRRRPRGERRPDARRPGSPSRATANDAADGQAAGRGRSQRPSRAGRPPTCCPAVPAIPSRSIGTAAISPSSRTTFRLRRRRWTWTARRRPRGRAGGRCGKPGCSTTRPARSSPAATSTRAGKMPIPPVTRPPAATTRRRIRTASTTSGRRLGVQYEDSEELKAADKIAERDRHRWELDPASAEDYPEHDE